MNLRFAIYAGAQMPPPQSVMRLGDEMANCQANKQSKASEQTMNAAHEIAQYRSRRNRAATASIRPHIANEKVTLKNHPGDFIPPSLKNRVSRKAMRIAPANDGIREKNPKKGALPVIVCDAVDIQNFS